MSISRNRIRVAVNVAAPYADLIDLAESRAPRFARARATSVEIGIHSGDAFSTDISDITSVTVEIKTYASRGGAPLATKTVSAASFDLDLTAAEWENDIGYHLAAQFDASDLGFAMGGATEIDLWMVITAQTPSGTITLAAGGCSMIDDGGLASADMPAAGDPQYYTKEQVDALIQSLLSRKDVIIDSSDSVYRRRLSVTNDGIKIDEVTHL